MDKEKAEFAARLRAALEARGIEASAAVVEKRFNSRYDGAPVTAQAISGWLSGRYLPKQDKLRVLAAMVGVDPHVLQYGGKQRVGLGKGVLFSHVDQRNLLLGEQGAAHVGIAFLRQGAQLW